MMDTILPPELVEAARRVIAANAAIGRNSNDAKLDLLNVSSDVMETFGAVSIAIAWSMAQGALEASNADVAVAITGVAGPDGGSVKKPIGTVVFARAEKGGDPADIHAERKDYGDLGRGGVRLQAALCALELLLP